MTDGRERFHIGTTRFSDETWAENVAWRKKHNWTGCVYGLMKRMPRRVPDMGLVYVIEMNNSTNKIMGIGLVRNFINWNNNSRIYESAPDYNRYVYNSAYRRDRDEISNKRMLEALELLVFKGFGHYKRGQGITTIPSKRFKGDKVKNVINKFFRSLF